MLRKLLSKLIGDANARTLKRAQPLIDKINILETEYQKLSEEELKLKTSEFRDRIIKGATLDDLLPEAFAVVKNACRRLCGTSWSVRGNDVKWQMIPYDVQLLGGIILHDGKIAEMKTGEGKTLVCTLPLYLNALAGKGCHLVTVNSYLATRDSEWMGGLFRYLGLTVSVVEHGMDTEARKAAYQCDITYGTNTEFGFDYLRDNMARKKEERVQCEPAYAIVDEVDSILIDEARTPLIVSAPAAESTSKYGKYAQLIPQLVRDEHYELDEKQKTATLTEVGITKMENLLGLKNIYTEAGYGEVHHIEQSLKAQAVFTRDKDYVVRDGEILIVDEFTGRLMPGRRYSDGLHQALEAKEGVEVRRESKTLATITLQNYFRLYPKLAGMTGTAKTEEEEFSEIYNLDVVIIPTHRPISREDRPDSVYKTEAGKLMAVAKVVQERHAAGQPVLVGTITIEKSEQLAQTLLRSGVPHKVLNAKHHEQEAEIIARAGERGAVTIATNMAGRGTDIKLGEGVNEVGGLFVLGTERHESRRIDNQLRGRSGRQGDPGVSQFFVSMEDSLMRLFGGDKMKNMMDMLKVPEDMPIENGLISRNIESAQKKVEAHNFDIRKHIVQYDDVMNKHREIVYGRRKAILEHEDIGAEIQKLVADEAASIIDAHALGRERRDWELERIVKALVNIYGSSESLSPASLENFMKIEELGEFAVEYLKTGYAKRAEAMANIEQLRHAERQVYLTTIDRLWMEHLENMRYLREKVSLRGYGQRDPLIEYKGEAYQLFESLLANIRMNTVHALFKLEIAAAPTPVVLMKPKIITNEDEIEDILTGDRELTPEQQREMQQAAAQVLKPDVKVVGLGKEDSISVIRADDSAPSSAPVKTDNPTVIRVGPEDTLGSAPTAQLSANTPAAGRNDPCPCGAKREDGSPKKYKQCCGKNV